MFVLHGSFDGMQKYLNDSFLTSVKIKFIIPTHTSSNSVADALARAGAYRTDLAFDL